MELDFDVVPQLERGPDITRPTIDMLKRGMVVKCRDGFAGVVKTANDYDRAVLVRGTTSRSLDGGVSRTTWVSVDDIDVAWTVNVDYDEVLDAMDAFDAQEAGG